VTGVINTPRIENDRDQLWAEAVHLYAHGFQWWLSPDLEKLAAEQQEQFVEQDLWTSLLDTWITKWGFEHDDEPFTLADAMAGALILTDPKTINKPEQMRAASCLKALGYRRRRQRKLGERREWKWFPRG
jgi:putative DNA primase/helicase